MRCCRLARLRLFMIACHGCPLPPPAPTPLRLPTCRAVPYTVGYDVKDRGKVTTRLRRVSDALRRHKGLHRPQITVIPKARIPIIKVRAPRVWARRVEGARSWPPVGALAGSGGGRLCWRARACACAEDLT